MPALVSPSSRRRLAFVVLVSTLTLAALPGVASAEPGDGSTRPPALVSLGPGDALSRALGSGELSEAQYALERATSLFAPASVARRFGEVALPDPHLATIVLRDLAVRLHELSGADRARAIDLMARPDDSEANAYQDGDPEYGNRTISTTCDPDVCVHWVSTDDHPAYDHAATDAFAGEVLSTMQTVWATEVDAYGYREPKPDTNVLPTTSDGGDARFDVYLADLGPQLFGYCFTNDAKAATNFTTYDFSTYCVLDDDYSQAEYGYPDPLDPLQVTAAHEFFHAVQGAYDFLEDAWFMEGTAAWMEDEVFDDVNDLYFYLQASPLGNPTVPLDKATGLRVYGTWIWWRFLAESLGEADVIRDIWNRADGSAGAPDRYSTQATALELRSRGGSFGRSFADFAAWNARPHAFYEEGSQYDPAATQLSRTISGSNRSFTSNATLDHMSSRYIVVNRGGGVQGDAKLRVSLDGPSGKTDPQGRIVLVKDGGDVRIVRMRLNAEGRDTKSVAFGSDVVRAIVIASNASTRFTRCWQGNGTWSCWGTPVDENESFRVTASLVQ